MVAQVKELDAQQWVKTRSSLDCTESTFLTWTGKIYSFIPGEKRKLLFKMSGVSVSRCILTAEGSWDFTSRELTYYLDPQTGKILRRWENPWTGETLPVIHVANSPVQGQFQGKFPAQIQGDTTTFIFDIFPTYPNPLAENPQFAEYSPHPIYQATELFKLAVPTVDLFNSELASVSQVRLGWDRIGQWLPWMKMGNRSGYLIYSASGSKVSGLTELPQLLQDEINNRVPLYKQAPKVFLDGEDMTSWLYFQKHFQAYLAGEVFPLPEVEEL
ncbi:DUF1838 domain-containing protein [Umezakia ovalisporum]|uniref:DUF1838 domain-containing protein n=2 Tax=Umezakia ovalisporum TaxID=75695 RepID=A0AA43GZ20_9CYAN|nr:DUF1838 domain-containing protein [Umezakia ovalisporum]MDH6058409.1 DUF1838 domain-containing protein [Umezakia ovalisporum FSS-43]MDH6064178.1 DUF1838 domain-containing protein [Umezakia ovalisporum FSS-62]MDH6066360.1 DUF1838 domain-containing protein [Umezakia ovalisporum APH033B]MDH6070515.1 DUF1838 domain-containing protein [Umezakia ovalisporum CobakiLakeA]MDH6074331.1 DUF1838 domain-containing protein [Umezakia ovalisporum CS-1034]